MTARLTATIATLMGALGVAAGAFGAHALRQRVDERSLEIFETAVRYQMYHAFALLAAAWLISTGARQAGTAAWLFAGGVLVFSGSLYVMVASGARWLGAVTPIGGVLMIGGWIMLAVAARTLRY
jgi:uncharacterized membrane protein YgdD (TMEM256/DUF423 family)